MDAPLQIGGAPFILLLAKPFVQVRTNIRFKGGRSSGNSAYVVLRTCCEYKNNPVTHLGSENHIL